MEEVLLTLCAVMLWLLVLRKVDELFHELHEYLTKRR